MLCITSNECFLFAFELSFRIFLHANRLAGLGLSSESRFGGLGGPPASLSSANLKARIWRSLVIRNRGVRAVAPPAGGAVRAGRALLLLLRRQRRASACSKRSVRGRVVCGWHRWAARRAGHQQYQPPAKVDYY